MTMCAEVLDTSKCDVDSLETLSAIDLPGCSLTIWERAPLPDINWELNNLSATAFPDVRTRVHEDKAGEELAELIHTQGHDAQTNFPVWLADMTRLSEVFFDLADGRPVTARLETLDRTGCPRFHVDHSYLRLVCTYRGSGTEWLDEAQVDRLAQAGGEPNDAIIRYGQPNRMPTFAVGLMKGSHYPKQKHPGLVHRSPEIDPDDPWRVLFCLDC